MLNKIKTKSNKGYTLAELLVGITVFMVIMAASVEFFVSSLEMQQKVLVTQRMIDSVSYSLDYMSRAIRMAQADPTGACVGVMNKSYGYDPARIDKSIKFINYEGECQEFYWDESTSPRKLKVIINGSESNFTPQFLDIVRFNVLSNNTWDLNDQKQPRATIVLEVKGIKSNKPELQPTIKLQTTITQRNLEYVD